MKLGGFALFLAIFLSLYGGMHYYIYKKLVALLPSAQVYIAWIFVLLVLSPVIIQLLVKLHWVSTAQIAALIGYTWMGFALLFFSFALIMDAVRGVLWLAGKATRLNTPLLPVLAAPQITVAVLVLALAVCAYGVYAANQIHFRYVRFPTSKFPPGNKAFRIVQLTDLHLDLLTSEARIRRLVAAINELHPDLIVSTGDLVDMQANHISQYASILRKLHARYGCYAVTGNHEAFAGINDALAFTRDAGCTVLSDTGTQIDDLVNLVGVDDPAVIRMATQAPPPEADVLKPFENGRLTILLKHQPVINKASIPYFDLQLSGHVHGGQIFPFGLLTRLVYRVPMGMSKVGRATWLYVSYGSGTWGPPIRFLAPSEITVINIVPAEPAN
jgi:uncharacterized protein